MSASRAVSCLNTLPNGILRVWEFMLRLDPGPGGCRGLPDICKRTRLVFSLSVLQTFTGGNMNTLRRLRCFWIPALTTIALLCFNEAVARTNYQVTDLGTLEPGFFGCSMGLNNHGWTETQYGLLDAAGAVVKGHVAINLDGLTFGLGTLGGANSWDNPFGGEINDRGEAVGYSELAVLDPDGEDVCAFGTHHECRAFLWKKGHMRALPTLGGNNAQASAMNNRGQITGFAETTTPDPGCPASNPAHI